MAFALYPDEPVAAGLRRIALELVDDAGARMASLAQPDKDVHETRKNVKKLRAVLRLGRDGLGETVYQRDNPYLRDFNRRSASLREAFVQQKLLRSMQKQFKKQLGGQDLTPLLDRLEREHRTIVAAFVNSSDRRAAVAAEVAVLKAAVSTWPDFGAGSRVLKAGLKRIYGRGRGELEIARQSPGTETFHQWRKRVKYLWYQLRILGACWPRAMDPYVAALDELAELLGDDHDLGVFQAEVLDGEIELPPAQRKALLHGLLERRREFAGAALALGARCYVESPGAFSRRVIGYWRHFRSR